MKSNLALKKSLYALIVSLVIASPLSIATAAEPENTQAQNAQNSTNVKLTQVKGRVMVNTSTVYTQASSGALLATGTKLVTSRGASALLVYKNGCVKKVEENKILIIGNDTECIAKIFNEKSYQATAVGDTVPDAAPLVTEGAGAVPATSVLAWSAGVIGMTLLHDHNHNNNPAISLE